MGRMMLDIHVPFLEAGLLFWLYFWNPAVFCGGFPPPVFLLLVSFKSQLYNKEQKYFSSLAKDDIWTSHVSCHSCVDYTATGNYS